jgi:hypothetical protein
MALTLSEIQALTNDVWMPGAANNWQMGNILMYKLLDNAQPAPSGEYVRQVLEYARSYGGAMGATTVFNTAKKAIFNAARFPWAYFWAGATYDIDDEVKVSSAESGVDLIMAKLDNMQSSIKDYMGDSLWAAYSTAQATYGSETVPFYGVADLFAATSSYGSIGYTDLGTFTNAGTDSSQYIWAPYSSSTTYSMSFETLQLLSRCTRVGSDNGKEIIDLIVTTATLKDSFESQLAPSQRFYDSNLAKAGFEHVNFREKCPVVVDDKATASYVQGFNMSKLILKPHKDFFFTPPKWKEPTNQYTKTCQIIFSGALVTGARRAHGQLTSVNA